MRDWSNFTAQNLTVIQKNSVVTSMGVGKTTKKEPSDLSNGGWR